MNWLKRLLVRTGMFSPYYRISDEESLEIATLLMEHNEGPADQT